MKKLIILFTILIGLSSCEIKNKPIKEEPTHYYLVEVKYTDNSIDTFNFNYKYADFKLYHSDEKTYCFYSHLEKVACHVKRFKVLKDSIL